MGFLGAIASHGIAGDQDHQIIWGMIMKIPNRRLVMLIEVAAQIGFNNAAFEKGFLWGQNSLLYILSSSDAQIATPDSRGV